MSKRDWDNELKSISTNEIQSAIERCFADIKPLDGDDREYIVNVNDIKYELMGGMSFSVSLSSDFKKDKEPF